MNISRQEYRQNIEQAYLEGFRDADEPNRTKTKRECWDESLTKQQFAADKPATSTSGLGREG